MLRRAIIAVLLGALTCAFALPGVASAFDPATQSHRGACAQETVRTGHAVRDYRANGVLADFAHLVGIRGSEQKIVRRMRSQLVLGRVARRTVTANHGCDGSGDWFSVGSRTLHAKALVALRIHGKRRHRLCGHAGKDCKRIVKTARVVFPVNCWNPNMGKVRVVLYVRRVGRHKAKRHKTRKPVRHVAAQQEEAPPTPAPTPPTLAPTPPPTAMPSANATAQGCTEGGGVSVTLSNAASATASASFTVNGTAYGPITPGGSATVTIPISPEQSTTVTVISGETVLIDHEAFTDGCYARPAAAARFIGCGREGSEEAFFGEVEVSLANEAGAGLPASFLLEWSYEGTEAPPAEIEEYGPLAPGSSEHLIKHLEFLGFLEASPTLRITSGGKTLLTQKFGESQEELCIIPD